MEQEKLDQQARYNADLKRIKNGSELGVMILVGVAVHLAYLNFDLVLTFLILVVIGFYIYQSLRGLLNSVSTLLGLNNIWNLDLRGELLSEKGIVVTKVTRIHLLGQALASVFGLLLYMLLFSIPFLEPTFLINILSRFLSIFSQGGIHS